LVIPEASCWAGWLTLYPKPSNFLSIGSLRLYSLLDAAPTTPQAHGRLRSGTSCLDELRSMSLAIPGSTGLFSVLQHTLRRGDKYRVRLNRHVYNCAIRFSRTLPTRLNSRPTHFRELVPLAPSDIGACRRLPI
jgi:hypothetical protein